MFKTYSRILSYALKYKKRIILGLLLAFGVSVFNGISLSALKPVFDILGSEGKKPFQLGISDDGFRILHKSGYTKDVELLFSKSSLYDVQAKVFKKNKKNETALTNFESFKAIASYWLLKVNLFFIDISPFTILFYTCLFVLPIYLFKLFCTLGAVYFMSSSGLLAVRDMRKELYLKLQRLPLDFYMREKTGIMMSRIINDVMLISNSISNELRISIVNFFVITTHIVLLALISYKLLIFSFIAVPLLLWPINYFAKKIKGLTKHEQEYLGELNGHLQEFITGIRVIRAFAMEKFQEKKFSHLNHNLYSKTFKYGVNHTIGPSLVELTTSSIVIGLLLYGGFRVLEGDFSAGSFLTFLFTLIVILSPIKQVASWYNMINRTVAAGERVFELIEKDEEVNQKENTQELGTLEKEIEFKKVYFSYDDTKPNVLKNISFKAPIGKTMALVGHSGAGKSTLVDLIPRFYDLDRGQILFDGVDIKDLTLDNLRGKIGVVTQDIFLFNGSVFENLSSGREDISLDDVKKAAKMAYAHQFIEKLPQGYDTVISERGLTLSGGQRQRLSIARALVKDPEVLILDEATSALDTESERVVQKALSRLMKNRTTFVIAHRLSTVYNADSILVVDKGRIVERGTHRQLIRKGGVYKKLYKMQFQS